MIISTVAPRILLISSLFIYPTDAQLDFSKKNVTLYIKIHIKCCYMFRFYNHHQGASIRALLML